LKETACVNRIISTSCQAVLFNMSGTLIILLYSSHSKIFHKLNYFPLGQSG